MLRPQHSLSQGGGNAQWLRRDPGKKRLMGYGIGVKSNVNMTLLKLKRTTLHLFP